MEGGDLQPKEGQTMRKAPLKETKKVALLKGCGSPPSVAYFHIKGQAVKEEEESVEYRKRRLGYGTFSAYKLIGGARKNEAREQYLHY